MWKGIWKGWGVLKKRISFDIGSGDSVRFWKDRWCGDDKLSRSFPLLFRFAATKEDKVSAVIQVNGEAVCWSPYFLRQPHDWELDSLGQFFELFYAQKVNHDREDRVLWVGTSNSKFTVRSFYKDLAMNRRIQFLWKQVWKSKAPTRVAVFVYEAVNGAILTGDNLRARKKIYTNWCYMCKKDGESVDHLLMHCPVAGELWNFLFSLFQIEWVMPSTVRELFLAWSLFKQRRRNFIWETAPLGVCWVI